jgi:aspartate ammonia-lyase
MAADGTREERDLLGTRRVPEAARHGIHTERALENFALSGRPVHPALARAYGDVKLACARANRALGIWLDEKADAIERACAELAAGDLAAHVVVDALQGGAGTSTNMNVNELLANRALELLGRPHGDYATISPLDDLNRHQSTNDTFPTALRVAAIRLVRELEQSVVALQNAFQAKEQEFARVVKVGRTELQDAVLVTLGREMGAYAEAVARDRWRIYKCEERLRVVNLGGTAVGTGLGAPRAFIFAATERLREATGIGFARAENLIEATQNADVFVEVSGILKACAVTLLKITGDLRLLASGPDAGLGEIKLPPRQAGSSIMPDKVNPVIPEAVAQAAMRVIGNDQSLTLAAASGSLELNPFLPLVADCLLESLELLARGCDLLARLCVEGITADEVRCRAGWEGSTATATALLPLLGHEEAQALASRAAASGRTIRDVALAEGLVTPEQFDALTSAEAVTRLGTPDSTAGADADTARGSDLAPGGSDTAPRTR